MKKSLLLVFTLILICCSKKKEVRNFENPIHDSVSSYFVLSDDQTLSKNERFGANSKALEIVLSQKNDSIHRVSLVRIANRFYNLNSLPSYESTVRVLMKESIDAKDSLYLAKSYSYLGDYYAEILQQDSAYSFYFKAEKLFSALDDHYNLGRTRFNKANLLYFLNDYTGSESAVFNALRVIKGKEGKDLYFDCFNLLGIIYNDLGEHKKAIEFNKKAFNSIDDKVNNPIGQPRAMSLNNMGLVYQFMKDHKKALFYFEKGLKEKNLLLNQPSVYAMLLDNLAYSRFKVGSSKNVINFFFKALKVREEYDLQNGVVVSKMHLSEFYDYNKNRSKAIQFAKEALHTARGMNIKRSVLAPLKQLSIIDPPNAAAYSSEYLHISDSVHLAERKIGEKFTRIEYETDKIKDDYSDLEDKNRNLIYIFSFFAILGLFFYIIKIQRARHRELLYKQGQQQANAEIYNLIINQQSNIDANRVIEKKRVAQELHDGVLGRMFGVRMNLEGLNSFQDELAVTQRKEYIIELKKIEQDIREISHEMNREKSELINNFVAIVNNLFEEQRKTFQTKLVTTIDRTINWELASNIVKINLYRIIQESLQNCNKYAKAKTIKVELKKVDGDIHLLISDDGEGFNMKVLKRGIGLRNMISRAKECQGNLNILSNEGDGTTITLVIPLEQKQIPA
ncbi:sensor histidine kinase [Flavobacterium faecale]|uniref:histidine kinase n=1 Tax=Flavobacterium faecale TaxID=1355330 RepID=A0A2S1LBE8_9FLAO|nr:tetratricopeptide repeat-containing sensor histidine kinase [Flavobacterium faecale]AWG21034.1 sensor histidine kinase [Flavobacterium faecale]